MSTGFVIGGTGFSAVSWKSWLSNAGASGAAPPPKDAERAFVNAVGGRAARLPFHAFRPTRRLQLGYVPIVNRRRNRSNECGDKHEMTRISPLERDGVVFTLPRGNSRPLGTNASSKRLVRLHGRSTVNVIFTDDSRS